MATVLTATKTSVGPYDRLVEDLAVKHREPEATRGLMAAGMAATPAVRRGLRHPNPAVRVGCCGILDHFMDEAALPELIANLTHADEHVRSWALHALACDRCKEGACRPGEDPSRWVRKSGVGVLGPAVHRRDDVRRALEAARDHDPDPLVRKVARWYAPGGTIYRRLAPKKPRKK
jgi:hypothetical protein